MKRFVEPVLAAVAVAVVTATYATLAQSTAPASADASREWPTYGHDSGGMRFSPLTEITPANVGQLQVAWTYHMKPPAAAPPAAAPAGAGAGVIDAPPAAAGRGRGRGGSLLSSSETTPIVVERHDVHRHAVRPRRRARSDDRQGDLGVSTRRRAALDARRRVLARRRGDAGADRLRHQQRPSSTRSTRRPASPTRPSATRASSI